MTYEDRLLSRKDRIAMGRLMKGDALLYFEHTRKRFVQIPRPDKTRPQQRLVPTPCRNTLLNEELDNGLMTDIQN